MVILPTVLKLKAEVEREVSCVVLSVVVVSLDVFSQEEPKGGAHLLLARELSFPSQ